MKSTISPIVFTIPMIGYTVPSTSVTKLTGSCSRNPKNSASGSMKSRIGPRTGSRIPS